MLRRPYLFPCPGVGIRIRLRDRDGIPESRQEKRPQQKNIIFPNSYISSPAPRSTDEAECSSYPLPSPKRKPGLSMLRCAASTARALRPLAAQPICNRGSWCSRQSGFAALAAYSPLSDLSSDWNVSCHRSHASAPLALSAVLAGWSLCARLPADREASSARHRHLIAAYLRDT